jgi:hypothetical protein
MSPAIELRLRADAGEWSPWYGIGELELEADGRAYGENLVAWPQAREVQVRVRAGPPLTEQMQELTVVAIDASDGPTTDQAARAAQVRTEAAAAASTAGVPQPRIIRRSEWGADESLRDWDPEYAPVDKMIIHHTVNGGGGDPAAEVRSIYYFHAVTRGWGDIGYQFLVDRLGNVYEGRYGGPDVVGAHVFHWNVGSMGVSVLGCYDAEECEAPQLPTAATLAALADLNAWAASRRALDPRQLRTFTNEDGTLSNYVLAGHRDYSPTACPGGSLYATLPDLREAVWARLPQYDVRFGWHDTPQSIEAGAQVAVHPNLYNYGRLTWSDGIGVRLGYRWLKDGQVVAENTAAARILPGAVVKFGAMTALVPTITAPITPGTYTLRWDLYQEGVGWFADRPAPAGRSQPLELSVEITPAHYLDVQLKPSALQAGERLRVDVIMRGLVGYGFEARTHLPTDVTYLSGSGQGDFGAVTFESGVVVWRGTLGAMAARANFDVLIPPELSSPRALALETTLSIPGHPLLELERRFVVNGLKSYLPLVRLETSKTRLQAVAYSR